MKYCPEPEEIALVIDGGANEMVAAHIRECAVCSELAEELKSDAAVLARQPDLVEASLVAVRNRVHGKLQPSKWKRAGAAAAMAAAAALAAAYFLMPAEPKFEQIAVAAPAVVDVVIPRPAEPAKQQVMAATKRRAVPRVEQEANGEELMKALEQYLEEPKAPPKALSGDVVVAMQTADPDVLIILLPEGDGL